MKYHPGPPLFALGKLVATPAALEHVPPVRIQECLRSHVCGDWGTVPDEDKRANERALQHGARILSSYPIDPTTLATGHGENYFWIITEADRSSTCVLLPDDY